MNDSGRAERPHAGVDQLVTTLASALSLGVTWRIRHAVRKIEAAHESLAKHFANSLRTGTFCSYGPIAEGPL